MDSWVRSLVLHSHPAICSHHSLKKRLEIHQHGHFLRLPSSLHRGHLHGRVLCNFDDEVDAKKQSQLQQTTGIQLYFDIARFLTETVRQSQSGWNVSSDWSQVEVEQNVRLVVNVKSEVLNLTHNLETIQDVLADAERRQVKEVNVRRWLNSLKGVSFEIDDVLGE